MAITRVSQSTVKEGLEKANNFLAGFAPLGMVYDSIQTVTVGAGGAASIDFTSIPQTYQHLQIRVLGRSTAADNNNDLMLQVNADTAANYAWHSLVGTGSAAAASGLASQSLPYVAYRAFTAANATASIFGAAVIDVLDYSSTSKTKVFRALQGHDRNGAGIGGHTSTLWNSTSAITSVKLTTSASSFAQFSTAALYGLKAPAV